MNGYRSYLEPEGLGDLETLLSRLVTRQAVSREWRTREVLGLRAEYGDCDLLELSDGFAVEDVG
jgi:hypothetical protein